MRRPRSSSEAPRAAALVSAVLYGLAPPAAGQAADAAAPAVRATGAAGTGGEAPGRARENYSLRIEAPARIADAIRARTYVGRWQRRADYDPIQFEGLRERLPDEVSAILRAEGYFGGTVEISGDASGLTVTVSAGARTTVNRVELRVTGAAQADRKASENALARWRLPEGSFFDTETWQAGKRGLIDALHQEGYLRARLVASEARIDPVRTTASLSVEVDSGPRIAFGELQVDGLERYPRHVVDNLRTFAPGDPYTLDALLAFQARLRASGYFASASVLPELAVLERDPARTDVPLRVELGEYQAKRVVLGVGYSTDEGVRGQVGYEHRNLFGRAWRLESSAIASTRRQRMFANVRTPEAVSGHFIGFGGRLERQDLSGEQVDSSNLYIGRGRRSGDIEYFVSLQQQAERRTVDALPGEAPTRDSRHALVLGYSWNMRRLDSLVDPRRGFTLSTQVSGAREGLGSNRSFARVYGRAMRFIPMPLESVFAGGTLIALGELGWVAAGSRGDIPSENLFRAGGTQSIRGYGYQSLGVTEGTAVVGGRYLLLGSLEYQHPVREGMSAAVFYDIGNAVDSVHDYRAVAGYGIGLRWRTPVGPINLDLAYGADVHKVRWHLSVGYTF